MPSELWYVKVCRMRVNITVDVLIVVIFRGGGFLIFSFCTMRFDYFCMRKIKKISCVSWYNSKVGGYVL